MGRLQCDNKGMECDRLQMAAYGFPSAKFLPKEGQNRELQSDLKPDM